ncbi:MAG: 4Fe-4S binding protein [Deltaproteobacteria bacterium]|nr:4Fe-4S binding protein [Deltaproteobacteria bacterium]
MKIAVTATGSSLDDQVEARFGRTPYYLFVNPETMEFEAIQNPNVAAGGGVGIQSAQLMADHGVKYVLTGNCGPNASQVFGAAGIQVIVGVTGIIRQAVEQFKAGTFTAANQPNVASHFGMGGDQSQSMGGSSGMGMGSGRGMGMGGGRGQGMGSGRGMGMGGGRGQGMGSGRGMGMGVGQTGLPGLASQPEVPGKDETNALKEEARILEKQLQDIKRRIGQIQKNEDNGVARVNAQECNGCGVCIESCPVNAIILNDVAIVDENKCTGCGICIGRCPLGAITMV